MFRSLHNQIFLPFAGLLLVSVLGLGMFLAWNHANARQAEIELRLGQVVQTITESRFPLTQQVCEQLKGLTGAEFVVRNASQEIVATTHPQLNFPAGPTSADHSSGQTSGVQFDRQIVLGPETYFWSAIQLEPVSGNFPQHELHVFFPASVIEQLRWEAIWPTLLWSLVAGGLAIGLASLVARRLTAPIRKVRLQLQELARGNLSPRNGLTGTHEVERLGADVDRLAERLAESEQTIRRTERMRTLGMLSGGLAHQLRNSATGARLAIDLHRERCQPEPAGEGLDVAVRQLQLMERFIQKFLQLGKERPETPQSLELGTVLDSVLPLVRPFAQHHAVDLDVDREPVEMPLVGDRDALEDLLLNLLLNAVEAVSQLAPNDSTRRVRLVLRKSESTATLLVEDNGPGVPAALQPNMFEAFVSAKPDGAGLGLALVKQICHAHQGQVDYRRSAGCTQFVVTLPLANDWNKHPKSTVGEFPCPRS